jgi:hypothetical protein
VQGGLIHKRSPKRSGSVTLVRELGVVESIGPALVKMTLYAYFVKHGASFIHDE